MTPRILVAGIGNIFLGDDAFGSEVARQLLRREWPAHVRVEDFGIRSFDLVFALSVGYETVILVDVTPRGGTPGTVYTIEPDLIDLGAEAQQPAALDGHSMDPMLVLATAQRMGAPLRRVLIVGCEPVLETIDPNGAGMMGLSAPVRAAMAEAIAVIETLVAQITSEASRQRTRAIGGG